MANNFDTIVIGLGAMGSAAVYQLAKRSNKVLGLDQFSPPHPNGSSHGETRIIRQAIGEGEEYVPFALRSYELWREIEKEASKELLTITGGLTLQSQTNADRHARVRRRRLRCGTAFDRAAHCVPGAGEPTSTNNRHSTGNVDGSRGLCQHISHSLPRLQ